MSVAISPSKRVAPVGVNLVHGVGRVGFAMSDGVARLCDLYQHDPIRILFPTPPREEIPSAVFVTTSGGLVGGDVLELAAQAQEDVAVQFYQQAAEKVYRSTGRTSRIDVALSAQAGSWLEWLPQETIAFDGARLHRTTDVSVAPGAKVLAGEFLVLGRTAMGEHVSTGLLRDDWTVRRDGRLIWADAFCLDGDIAATQAHPAGLGGALAVATALYVADDAADFLETARGLLDDANGVKAAATVVGGVLVVRFLGQDTAALRRAFGNFWAGFRHAAAGLPASLPRLWHI